MKMRKIVVDAIISASIHKVWDYYTNPQHITKWNFADPSWHCPMAENDLRVNGKYSARMEAKDGSFGFDFEAVYNEVTNGKSFTYTMTDGRVASTTFEADGENTKIIVAFDPEKENPIDVQKAGWLAILNNFKMFAESH